MDGACSLLEQGEETWADGQHAKQELTSVSSITSPDTGFLDALEQVTLPPCVSAPHPEKENGPIHFPLQSLSLFISSGSSSEALVLTGACWVPSMVRVCSPGCHRTLINHSNKSCQRNIN